ncbi:hypothetical protein MPSEU_000050400 [Mayamaea pseudoterrestris]|nr:hypothetical protein MPSEU_000050400 [Mayamaea pseudoterrestris]
MAMLTPTATLTIGNSLTLTGRSRAGDGTSFFVPELRWMLDAGALVTTSPPRTLFITHTHSDHVSNLGALVQKAVAANPLVIYAPEQTIPLMQRHIDAYFELIECGDEAFAAHNQTKLNYTLQPVQLGQEYIIKQKGGKEYIMQPIECDHRIVCYGYSIFRMKERLKREYATLSGREIGSLKRQAISITESVKEPVLCFLGDTTHRVFEKYPDLPLQHDVIIVECSFIDDADLQRAEETKHMHWKHLRPVIQAHPNTMFLLTHFSLKYSSLRLMKLFRNAQTKYGLRNLHPMLIQMDVAADMAKGQAKQNGSKSNGKAPACQCRLCCAH